MTAGIIPDKRVVIGNSNIPLKKAQLQWRGSQVMIWIEVHKEVF